MESTPLIRPTRHIGVASAILLNINRIVGTGIFTIPGGIYSLTGSVGWSLVLWLFGAVVILSGFCVYLEYGLEMPHTGGELNYLSRVYRKPKYLATVTYAMAVFILEFSATNAYAFGLYIQLVFGREEPSEQASRYIACVTIIVICAIHTVYPEFGKRAFNILGIFKVVTLVAVSFMGLLVLSGLWKLEHPPHNFSNLFANDGFGGSAYDYATALLRVSYSYRGWETVNSVLGEVKNPHRTMLIAGPVSILLAVGLYFLCNLAYFAVIPKHEIAQVGAVIAGRFFEILLGKSVAARLLPLCVCLSNLGNILVVSFACARVVAEFGHHHIVPFSDTFASLKPFGTPIAGLALHAFSTCVVVLAPPSGDVYEFIVDLSTYPVAVIALAITAGLYYLHRHADQENWGKGANALKAPLIAILVFGIVQIYMVIAPWIPPPVPSSSSLPYYAYPLGSVGVFVVSGLWWAYWRDTDSRKKFEVQFGEQVEDPALARLQLP